MNRILNVGTSVLATVARLGFGERMAPIGPRPEKLLEIYEFEACPFCRKAREALTVLSLDVIVYPCPKNGPRFRKKVMELGGKAQFPYLIDPNTDTAMYESGDIINYLFKTYGQGRPPLLLSAGPFGDISAILASLARVGQGRFYSEARPPQQLLELYQYEGSPFCRLVRELLCELEIPYIQRNVPINSPDRAAFVALSGRMRVPYLIDPNQDVAMFESAEIADYLHRTYAAR